MKRNLPITYTNWMPQANPLPDIMGEKRATLAALPAELLRLIINHLASQHDHSSLLNLGRCSKRLAVLALPPAKAAFYHRIEIVLKIYVNLNDAGRSSMKVEMTIKHQYRD